MSALKLPDTEEPARVSPRLLSWGNDQTPMLGGPTTRLQRIGDRWALDVVMPPLDYEEAMAWSSRVIRGRRQTLSIAFPQPEFDTGTPGAARVNGAGQLGMFLTLDGLTPHYVMREGQFFSFEIGDDSYLYQCNADVAANAAGQMVLGFEPMLRASPADNTLVNIVEPVIAGFTEGRDKGWNVEAAYNVGLTFTIVERA